MKFCEMCVHSGTSVGLPSLPICMYAARFQVLIGPATPHKALSNANESIAHAAAKNTHRGPEVLTEYAKQQLQRFQKD